MTQTLNAFDESIPAREKAINVALAENERRDDLAGSVWVRKGEPADQAC